MIGSSENRVSYNGNGIATEFAYTFKILEKSNLKILHVAADGTEELLTTDYYVDMEKSVVLYPGYAPGAEIPEQNRPPILPVGERLVIYREVPITQESALDKHWPFNVIENGLDKLTIICQQIWDRLQRSFYVSESTSTNFDPKVPIEAGKTFRVKDDGSGFEVTEDPGKVIDGATSLLKQTTEQAEFAKEQADASSQSAVNAQNAANTAEKIATDLGLVDEAVQTAVASATTASDKADVAAAKADVATDKANEANLAATTATAKADATNQSAINAAQSYANADAIATQLTEYLNTKETLTAPAVDKTLLIEGAAADSNTVGTNIKLAKDVLKCISDGEETLYAYCNFAQGGLNNDGSYNTTKYRVAMTQYSSFEKDITLSVKDGFRYYIHYFSNGVWDRAIGWQKGNYTIPANQQFSLLIARVNESTSENADLSTFISQLTFKIKPTLDSLALDERIGLLEETKNRFVTQSKNLVGDFANGTINASTGIYTPLTSGFAPSATPEMVPVTPNTNYVLSWNMPNILPKYVRMFEYDENGLFIQYKGLLDWQYYTQQIVTTSPNVYFVRFLLINTDNGVTWDSITPSHFQMELSKTGQPTSFVKKEKIDKDRIDANEQYTKLIKDGTIKYDFYVPEYYHDNDYLKNKISTINSYLDSCYENADAFIFITDAHWKYNQKHSPALIRYIYDHTGVNKVIDGGDGENGKEDRLLEYTHTLNAAFWNKTYYTVGNHECFNGATSGFITNAYDMHREDYKGNASKHYYYFDNARTKIRYIVLANFYCGGATNGLNGIAVDTEQQDWLRNEALNIPSGWSSIIVTHLLYSINVDDNSLQLTDANLENILDENKNKIICVLQGHTHRDRITYTNGGIPVIINTCDKQKAVDLEGHVNQDIIVPREIGTIREQAFDVVVINKKDREIKLIRIGCPAQNGIGDNIGEEVEVRTVNFK